MRLRYLSILALALVGMSAAAIACTPDEEKPTPQPEPVKPKAERFEVFQMLHLRSSELVRELVRTYYDSGRLVAAICGAPTVLAKAGVAHGCRVTCHSSVVAEMGDYNYIGGSVVEDGNVVTGAGAGVSVEFALKVVERLVDVDTIARVRKGMEV